MAQWWGGERVPMTGIAAVGIAPEYRGTGAAIALMQHTVKELHAKGYPLAIQTELHLEVEDDLIAENNGYHLTR